MEQIKENVEMGRQRHVASTERGLLAGGDLDWMEL
jgi:hypothetical protein